MQTLVVLMRAGRKVSVLFRGSAMESGLEGLGFCGEKSDPARENNTFIGPALDLYTYMSSNSCTILSKGRWNNIADM